MSDPPVHSANGNAKLHLGPWVGRRRSIPSWVATAMLVSVTRRRLIGGAAGGLLLAVCGGRGALAAATTGHPRMPTVRPTLPSREFFIPYTERPIGNGGLAAGQVALTFDDGPHAGLTPLVLDTL